MTLQKQIQTEMHKQKISVPKMARKLDCHQETLYRFFSGRSQLGSDTLGRLIAELGGRVVFD